MIGLSLYGLVSSSCCGNLTRFMGFRPDSVIHRILLMNSHLFCNRAVSPRWSATCCLCVTGGTRWAGRRSRLMKYWRLPNGFPSPGVSGGRSSSQPVSYTHLRAHETRHDLVCRLLLE